MKFDYAITISSIVNIIIYLAIIIALYKGMQRWKSFLRRSKEMDKKLDDSESNLVAAEEFGMILTLIDRYNSEEVKSKYHVIKSLEDLK